MKKLILSLIAFTAFIVPAMGNDLSSPLQVDVGAGLSFAGFDPDEIGGSYAQESSLILSLLSIRGGVNADVRYYFSDSLSAGAELGLYTLSIKGDYGTFTYYDIPLRGVLRWGNGKTFLQVFGGYYLTLSDDLFDGIEAGARISLGGLYISAAYTRGDMGFMRYEIGYALNNLLN